MFLFSEKGTSQFERFVKREQRPNRRQTESNIKLWSSERRGQTDDKPRAISSLLEYCRGAKEEDEVSCLDYAEP